MDFEGNFHILKNEEKNYECNVTKITLHAEPAPGQDRPTQPKLKFKNQGECFAPPRASG